MYSIEKIKKNKGGIMKYQMLKRSELKEKHKGLVYIYILKDHEFSLTIALFLQ